jgi:hypothetical protein
MIISTICKKKKIPLFFIPHGSYSGETLKENPMHFEYALVAGEHQKRKIKAAHSNSNIHIIGRPLSDRSALKYNRSTTLKYLGVCISLMDNFENIDKLIQMLNAETKLKIIIRPHPQIQNTKAIKKFILTKNLTFSNALIEDPLEFLEKMDCVIAGCSGILLDAAEMNVYPIFYESSQRYYDFNDFVKNGLATFVSNPQECLKLIKRLAMYKPNIRMRAKYYNGIIGTGYDGKSSMLAKELIIKNISIS